MSLKLIGRSFLFFYFLFFLHANRKAKKQETPRLYRCVQSGSSIRKFVQSLGSCPQGVSWKGKEMVSLLMYYSQAIKF